MDKRTRSMVSNFLVTVAAEEVERATHSLPIVTNEAWIDFDRACHKAYSYLDEALIDIHKNSSEGEEAELDDNLRKLHALRIRVWEDWQMKWREQEAIRDPTGRYGLMRLRREHLEETLAGTEGVIAAFGNFMVGYRILDHTSNMSVQRLVELYAEAGLVGFKVHKRVGGYCIRPANKSIVLLTEHA